MSDSSETLHAKGWPSGIRIILFTLSWLALTVYFHSQVRQVMDTSLDASNYASYAYFTAHGFQYGPEVVPMAGPYGFILYGWTYSGNLFGTRIFYELILNSSLALLTLWFFVRNRGSWYRWAWLGAHIAFTPFIEDLPIEWTLLLAGLFLVQGRRVLPTLLVASLLALLSLIKGTHLILALATLGVVAAAYIYQRKWSNLLLIIGSYFGSLFLFWSIAGQAITNIPAYLIGIWELASGYNDAMSLDEAVPVLIRGVVVFGSLLLSLAWAIWNHRKNLNMIFSVFLFSGYAFVQWKHGFVRADGHAYIFFHYAVVAAFASQFLWKSNGSEHTSGLKKYGNYTLLAVTLIACFYGSKEPMLPNLVRAPGMIVERLIGNIRQLSDLSKAKIELSEKLTEQSQLHDMPLVRAEVGQRSIDLFGFEHGLIPLNGLNYHPRPMGGGAFNVYTPSLMKLNSDFLHDPIRRPDYYLLKVQTIDYRLNAADDGLALKDLLYYYEPVLAEHDHLLLKATPTPSLNSPRLLSKQNLKFGDIVQVPAVRDREILIARFKIVPNLLGRIRSAIYKLPRVRMGMQGVGIAEPEGRRLVPAMVGSPFILSPVIENNHDWLQLFTDRPGKTLTSFRISTSDRTWFDKTIQVEFFSVPRPVAADKTTIEELLPFTQTTIESISTQLPTGKKTTLIGQLLQPPSEFSWGLNGTERSLSFGYGLVPAAYLEGRTDGVRFVATLQRPGLPPVELFRQLLEPVTKPSDQGHHLSEMILPRLTPHSRVVLTTDSGPQKDNSWDWAYISALQFKYNKYPSGLFPGFNTPPTSVETNSNPIANIDGRRLFMVHAPSTLNFPLNGDEHVLQINFGLLPGAYSGEGKTDGVDYVVEILHADQSKAEIFRRPLRPLTVSIDRGEQSASIPLSNLKKGDQLTLRVTPGPADNDSWDWSYLARLNLQ